MQPTNFEMINKLAINSITAYQQYISPHKGYCCAYRILSGEPSCSAYAIQQIQTHGVFEATPRK
jgi:putative component of membrane protein insertase Oxa1/YidC/SpoIIIJ protein YidD